MFSISIFRSRECKQRRWYSFFKKRRVLVSSWQIFSSSVLKTKLISDDSIVEPVHYFSQLLFLVNTWRKSSKLEYFFDKKIINYRDRSIYRKDRRKIFLSLEFFSKSLRREGDSVIWPSATNSNTNVIFTPLFSLVVFMHECISFQCTLGMCFVCV